MLFSNMWLTVFESCERSEETVKCPGFSVSSTFYGVLITRKRTVLPQKNRPRRSLRAAFVLQSIHYHYRFVHDHITHSSPVYQIDVSIAVEIAASKTDHVVTCVNMTRRRQGWWICQYSQLPYQSDLGTLRNQRCKMKANNWFEQWHKHCRFFPRFTLLVLDHSFLEKRSRFGISLTRTLRLNSTFLGGWQSSSCRLGDSDWWCASLEQMTEDILYVMFLSRGWSKAIAPFVLYL